jgi:phosphotransacetylase
MAIKECPFCKLKDNNNFIVMPSYETNNIAKVVKCLGCGAIGPYGASNEELAIEFWNDRKDK